MPRGDGTGPPGGGGPGTGRDKGAGRMSGTRPSVGGECVCPSCGNTVPHQAGSPCNQIICPKCGTSMVRKQGS